MLNCALVLPDRVGNSSLRAALKLCHMTSFDTCAGNAAWPRHHGHSHPISSCISGPAATSRSEHKAHTTCAEPPDNAATSLEISGHVLLSSLLTSAALGCTLGQNIISLPSINVMYTMNHIHCAMYIFNLNIIFPFKYRWT